MTREELYNEIELYFEEYGMSINDYRDSFSRTYDTDDFMCINSRLMDPDTLRRFRHYSGYPKVKYLLTDIGSDLITIWPAPAKED